MEGTFGVRKGTWTEEEDKLLRKCIEEYGEGRWHQVPLKAGLNRCRKSCRLRWLNYLKPNIKRGEFNVDEVDLIMRLHKLLGNRWSLIAGRLPGRTAYDVKNYWNSHLRKKSAFGKENLKEKTQQIMKTSVIKPWPRTFSKNINYGSEVTPTIHDDNILLPEDLSKRSSMLAAPDKEGMWWEIFLDNINTEMNQARTNAAGGSEELPLTSLWAKDLPPGLQATGEISFEEEESYWTSFSFDEDLWNLNGSKKS